MSSFPARMGGVVGFSRGSGRVGFGRFDCFSFAKLGTILEALMFHGEVGIGDMLGAKSIDWRRRLRGMMYVIQNISVFLENFISR